MTDADRLSGEQSSRSLSKHSMDAMKKQVDATLTDVSEKDVSADKDANSSTNANGRNAVELVEDTSSNNNPKNTSSATTNATKSNDASDSNNVSANGSVNTNTNTNTNSITDSNANTNAQSKDKTLKQDTSDSNDTNNSNNNANKNGNVNESDTNDSHSANDSNANPTNSNSNNADNANNSNKNTNENESNNETNIKNNEKNNEKELTTTTNNEKNEKESDNTNENGANDTSKQNNNNNVKSNKNGNDSDKNENLEKNSNNNETETNSNEKKKAKEEQGTNEITSDKSQETYNAENVENEQKEDGNVTNGSSSKRRMPEMGKQMSDAELEKMHADNKRAIFHLYTKYARSVTSYLQLSQIVALSHVCKGSRTMVDKLYNDKKDLDLSEYYGIIGSPEFDSRSFYKVFLPKWKNVESLYLRYCSHLQASHLDRIITALTPAEEESENEQVSAKDDRANMKIKHLNLYFCSRLGSNTLLKIRNRLRTLETLNIGRCYAITANKNYNAFKQLIGSPIKKLVFSLDPSIMKEEAMDVVSDLIHEQSFPNLVEVDLSHGCQILNEVDLSDLKTRVKRLIMPKKSKTLGKKAD